jgi:hypothetical protein
MIFGSLSLHDSIRGRGPWTSETNIDIFSIGGEDAPTEKAAFPHGLRRLLGILTPIKMDQ